MPTTCTCEVDWSGFPLQSPRMVARDYDCPVHGEELRRQRWRWRHHKHHYRQIRALRRKKARALAASDVLAVSDLQRED